MKTKTWIPKLKEPVMFGSDLWRILKVDMGGKCTIRRFTQKGTKGSQLKEVDINELEAVPEQFTHSETKKP